MENAINNLKRIELTPEEIDALFPKPKGVDAMPQGMPLSELFNSVWFWGAVGSILLLALVLKRSH